MLKRLPSEQRVKTPRGSSTKGKYTEKFTRTKGLPDGIKITHIIDYGAMKGDWKLLKRHAERGYWINSTRMTFGTVVKMAINHPIYGPGLQFYSFWQMISVDGKECPLFLCHMTNSHNGPKRGYPEWYQEYMNWSYKTENLQRSNVFITPVHSILLRLPDHGHFFAEEPKKNQIDQEELGKVKHWLNGFALFYKPLIRELSLLLVNASACHRHNPTCDHDNSLRRHMKQEMGRYQCSHRRLHRTLLTEIKKLKDVIYGIRRNDHRKAVPPAKTCEFFTGRCDHFTFNQSNFLRPLEDMGKDTIQYTVLNPPVIPKPKKLKFITKSWQPSKTNCKCQRH